MQKSIMKTVKATAKSGTIIVIASVMLSNILRLISSMTLTRILDSEAFGVVGIIMSATIIIGMLSDIGLLPFLVRHEDNDNIFLDEIWTIRLLRSVFLTLLMAAFSYPIAIFMGKPQLAPAFAVWSVNFLIDGLSSLSFATAVRNQSVFRLSAQEFFTIAFQMMISITLALILKNYWSLIISMIIGSSFKSLLSYTMFNGERRIFRISARRAKEVWLFSRNIALSSAMSAIIIQADQFVLGRYMSLREFGQYAIAATLASAPAAIVTPYTTRILFPIYASEIRKKNFTLKGCYYAKSSNISILYMSSVAALITLSPILVRFLYDYRYKDVAIYLEILSISSLIKMPNQIAEQGLIAIGNTASILHANIARICWILICGTIAIFQSKIIYLVIVMGTVEISATPVYFYMLKKSKIIDYKSEGFILIATLFFGASSWIFSIFLEKIVNF